MSHAFLHPGAALNSAPSSKNNGAAAKVPLGNNNNSLRLALPKRPHGHAPRTPSATASALKLAAAASCQKTKGPAPSALVPRENHDQDQPALSSLSENTVAMEVT
ncbi:hypothetical protein NHX12_004979 [Muraenolepis orangiensis]|uniref:Enhancer of polycomb C-terminal domain-containing protein n=1 Tax=Muraenolepis orangiensis TaxID=630683 RepID=A0A9Q0IG21_9TELE|nr:hypothetical protein NHX12_004979 [Muraenolepis orangiensis]